MGEPEDRDLHAILAHGLLNTLALISQVTATLLRDDPDVATDAVGDGAPGQDALVDLVTEQAAFFADGLSVLLRECSDAFGDAATTVALMGRVFGHLSDADRQTVLVGAVDAAATLQQGLAALVRGLPPDIARQLDLLGQR